MAHLKLKTQRNKEAQESYNLGRSSYYSQIGEGLIPKPFSIGDRAVAQLEHETQAVIAARAAGQSKEEIKALVLSLMAQRQELFKELSQ